MAMPTRTLPDDVVAEILLRLDNVVTLFRCATTCKHWCRLVTNPYFLKRRQWHPSLVGFFTKRCLGTGTSPTDRQLAFVPLLGSSLLGTRPGALSSFIHADDAATAALVDGATPLATRGGFLLVRLYQRDHDLKPGTFLRLPEFNPIVGLAVCNLLAGTWDVLPELDCQSGFGNRSDYGCDIVPCKGSPAFKVLMIGKDKEVAQYNLHTFVSGEASWRAPAKCFNMMEHQIWSMEQKGAVVCRGYAYWLFVSESKHFHVLNVDIETGHVVSLTKLLSPTKDGLLYNLQKKNQLAITSNGTRLSLYAYRDRRLEIWTQQQDDGYKGGDGDAEWQLTGEIGDKLAKLIQQLERPSCIWSGERGGTLFFMEHYGRNCCLYIAHLETGTLEEATDQFP